MHDQKKPSRGVLRIRCFGNMEQIYRRTPMPKCNFNKSCFATLLKSHIPMGALLQTCCIFSGHHFLRTPLEVCFCMTLLLELLYAFMFFRQVFSITPICYVMLYYIMLFYRIFSPLKSFQKPQSYLVVFNSPFYKEQRPNLTHL